MSRDTQPPGPIPPRPFLARLEPYVPGEQPDGPGWVKLNTNEFPYPAAQEVIRAIARETAETVRIYPNPTCAPLREALAERHGVEPDRILVGNGSDEILRLIAHAWCGPGRPLAMVRPTYTLFEVLAAQFEAETRAYPLRDGTDLPEALFDGDWAACFLAAPNPPLGTVFPPADLERLAGAGGLLVLDGAYVDFAPGRDPLDRFEGHPAVIHTRTFSKSFGLAGLRVGYAIGPRPLIGALEKLRDSYNVNRISQVAALAALEASDYYAGRLAEIIRSRETLAPELARRGFSVAPSQGNFLFASRPDAAELYRRLKERRILVRYFDRDGLEGGVRITIGTPDEIEALLDAIDDLAGQPKRD